MSWPRESKTRNRKLMISASCGVEPSGVIAYKPLLDEAIDISSVKPDKCIIFQRSQVEAELIEGRDIEWSDSLKDATPADCVPVASTDPLYILYTSGTTGEPKGVVRDNGGHLVALKWSMKNVYGVAPGEVFWAASDVGWVVGHSYITYAPLIHGCTTILFEGKPVGTPDAGVFWRIISEHGVKVFFTAPTAFRAIKRDDPDADLMKNYDLSCFRTLFLAGERSDSDTIQWAEEHLKVPVIDHYWQTESGWPMLANSHRYRAVFPSSTALPRSRCPAMISRFSTESAAKWGRARWARCASGSPCRPGVSPRCGTRTSASSTPI